MVDHHYSLTIRFHGVPDPVTIIPVNSQNCTTESGDGMVEKEGRNRLKSKSNRKQSYVQPIVNVLREVLVTSRVSVKSPYMENNLSRISVAVVTDA